jgi:drug/metabolite transporter (DMT)-like permease
MVSRQRVSAGFLAVAGTIFFVMFVIAAAANVDTLGKVGNPNFGQKVSAMATGGIFAIVAAVFFVGAAIISRLDEPDAP